MNDLQMRQFLRAENQYLNEPKEPETDEPRCAWCGCRRDNHTEIYSYHNEWVCGECLLYEGLNSDEFDELYAYDPEMTY